MAIFKHTRGMTLCDALEHAETWFDPGYFIGENNLTIAQKAATEFRALVYHATNCKQAADPLLCKLATDPDWTGIVFVNCPLDASSMPTDILMLLGGNKGELTAQYVAISQNTLDAAGTITRSSITARIHYEGKWDDTRGPSGAP
jgi:hypothetical protein